MADETAKADVLALARAAGLELAVNLFPDDVIEAAKEIEQERAELPAVDGVTEPWPPMHVRGRR